MEPLHLSANRGIVKLTLEGVPDRPGMAAEIFGTLANQGFNVELVVSSGGASKLADVTLAISRSQQELAVRALEEIRGRLGARALLTDSTVGLVTLMGQRLSGEPGIAGRMFRALSERGINIEVISTSMSSVTCMIAEDKIDDALTALRSEFSLAS